MKLSLPIIFSFFPFMGLCQKTATDTIQKTTIIDTILPLPYSISTAATDANIERTLSKSWELDRQDQRGTFHIMEYQPMYIMPVRFTDCPTKQPQSLNLNALSLSLVNTKM